MRNKIIYSPNEDDIQTTTLEEVERRLSAQEIENIKNSIAGKINWYDAIARAINQKINIISVS
ncbi:hypothetical protein [Agriterribacter sp.]|uniref:hypothetical protein n=1 Tax=Agriterribacter sp. TaxID=2821509 RepID=UPI002C22617C|nr:hypothetical protein [Agriterribacter sp.]HRP55612.1 hypothetical protein [Agriterribacter sp.]